MENWTRGTTGFFGTFPRLQSADGADKRRTTGASPLFGLRMADRNGGEEPAIVPDEGKDSDDPLLNDLEALSCFLVAATGSAQQMAPRAGFTEIRRTFLPTAGRSLAPSSPRLGGAGPRIRSGTASAGPRPGLLL